MPTSFHSKIAQHIVELELNKISKRNPSLGYSGSKASEANKVTWEMLIDSRPPTGADIPIVQAEAEAESTTEVQERTPILFPDELPTLLRAPSAPRAMRISSEGGALKYPVAIIGAGVAGLRVAMMLKHLGIDYVVYEASDCIGGRVYTYEFQKPEGEPDSAQNYFDVGAMRFPDNAANARTFELFEELGITKEGGPAGKLLPYNLSTDDNILLFNDIKKTVREISENPDEDHFHDGVSKGGIVPDEYITKTYTKPNGVELFNVDACLGAALEPYKFLLAKDYKLGWELLMQHDSRSTRAHLLDIMRYPPEVVQWMATRDSGNTAYDDAFTERVIDSLEFDYPTGYGIEGQPNPGEIDWWCIEGGSEVLTKAMHKSLGDKPNVSTSYHVTSISKSSKDTTLEVTIFGLASLLPVKHSHVVSTVSLASLRGVNLAGCELDSGQKRALRSIKYGTGIIIGIQFKTRWWQGKNFPKQGGSSRTDRQSRVVMYPSYDVNGPPDSPGVLIASYTWNHDAFQFGGLTEPKHSSDKNGEQTPSTDQSIAKTANHDHSNAKIPRESVVLDEIYEDLAALHGTSPEWYRTQTVDVYAYDWSQNRFTRGGYAFFSPGQFKDFYLEITKPAAGGYLHFGGEAASCHHGWVAGALDSAWRCVWEILAKDGTAEQKAEFRKKYGGNREFDDPVTAAKQYYRGVYANSLEKPEGHQGVFHFP